MPFITQCQCGSDMIVLKAIEGPFIGQLVNILNYDHKLAELLSSNKEPLTPDQFVEHNKQWAERTNSKMFAIVLNHEAIGSISLSHIDPESKTAQIGYWLSSNHWGKGYGSSAFEKILAVARETGISRVSSTIKKDNVRSRALWLKHGAQMAEENGKLKASLHLD
jgi:RimJ/RimL family protein N-acetyltransferase